jgi:hypothetical protein
MKITKKTITKSFLKKNDGKLVWIRDDYLSMTYLSGDKHVIDILNKVSELKSKMRQDGYIFKS